MGNTSRNSQSKRARHQEMEKSNGKDADDMRSSGTSPYEDETNDDCCKHKSTPRSAQLQSDVQKRLNRAIGQLNGVKAMIDENRYCGDVLTQLAAAESAVHRISEILLEEHMKTCVVEEIKDGGDEVIDELMALIRRFN